MKELLLVHKYRPKTLDDIILLPRIKKIFEDGVKQSYIFYGNYGAGKTSLAKILIGEYSKMSPFLEINVSLDTSIDVLRDVIEPFCKQVYIGLDLDPSYTGEGFKYVLLNEYDKASHSAQEAFKAFSEEYEEKGIRFILTTNHIDKINGGLRSRFVEINFSPESVQEEKYLKSNIYKYINDVILPNENIKLEKQQLVNLINKNFPDFRAMIKMIEYFKYTNELSSASIIDNMNKEELFKIIINNDIKYDDIYHFLFDKIGVNNIESLFSLLGRQFVTWYSENNFQTYKLFDMNKILMDYYPLLKSDSDPIILGMTVIGQFKKIHNLK